MPRRLIALGLLVLGAWFPVWLGQSPAFSASPHDAAGAYEPALEATDATNLVQHDAVPSQTEVPGETWGEPAVSAATVFQPDDRVAVRDTTSYGWRTVSYLGLYDEGGKFTGHCTGMLLGDNVVLTAAHCLYSAGLWVGSVLVAPGATVERPPFGTAWAYRTVVPRGWLEGVGAMPGDSVPPSPYDYGLVFLQNRPFGNLGPYLTVASAPDSYFAYVANIETAGFPGDRQAGSMWTARTGDYWVDDDYLYTRLDIWFGQSGSPIWSIGPNNVGFIFSVVSVGNDYFNRSVRFNAKVVSSMQDICQKNGCAIVTEDFSSYAIASSKLCRTSALCDSGSQPLIAGQPVRLAFSLSKLAVEPVRADVYWNDAFSFDLKWSPPPAPGTGTFYVTDPGLPPPPGPGVLRIDIWVGSTKAGSLQATVEGGATPTATQTSIPTATPSPKPTAPLNYRLRAPQLARDGIR